MRRLMQAMRLGMLALPTLGFFAAILGTSKIPRFDGESAHGTIGTAYADAPSCSGGCTGDSDCGCCADCAGASGSCASCSDCAGASAGCTGPGDSDAD